MKTLRYLLGVLLTALAIATAFTSCKKDDKDDDKKSASYEVVISKVSGTVDGKPAPESEFSEMKPEWQKQISDDLKKLNTSSDVEAKKALGKIAADFEDYLEKNFKEAGRNATVSIALELKKDGKVIDTETIDYPAKDE